MYIIMQYLINSLNAGDFLDEVKLDFEFNEFRLLDTLLID